MARERIGYGPERKVRTVTPDEKLTALRQFVHGSGVVGVYDVGVDLQTANAILTVYDALSPQHKESYLKMDLRKMGDVAWKVISKAQSKSSGVLE